MDAWAKLFSAPPEKMRRLQVTYGGDYSITKGEAPDTWTISGIQCFFLLEGVPDVGLPGTYTLDQTMTWDVRLASEPQPHYVIYREIVKDNRLE